MKTLVFKKLLDKDIESLTPMMKAAFDRDAFLHLNKKEGGPTGYDNGDFLRNWGLHKDATSFTIHFENNIVGAIILWLNPTTHIHKLGCIFVDPQYQDHHFYVDKCGFKVVNIMNEDSLEDGCYIFEKKMKNN